MEDARTGPAMVPTGSNSGSSRKGSGASKSHSSGRRRRHQSNSTAPDAKSCSSAVSRSVDAVAKSGRGSGLRALQDLVSETMTCRYSEAPPSPQQQQQQQQQHQSASNSKGDNFEDFMKYLGLADGSTGVIRGRRHHHRRAPPATIADRGRSESTMTIGAMAESASQQQQQQQPINYKSLCDQLTDIGATENSLSRYDRTAVSAASDKYARSKIPQPQMPQMLQMPQLAQQQQQPQPPQMPQPPAGDDFSEEENFYQLIGLILGHAERAGGGGGGQQQQQQQQHYWDAETVINSLQRYGSEFSDYVGRYRRKAANVFPFYQPAMLRMIDLLVGTFTSIGDAANSELLLLIEQLRNIRLSMRLFLHPEDALAEADDASLARLLLVYSEQLDRDLRAMLPPAAAAGGAAEAAKFAQRRATSLAAAVGRYARTAERRRQTVLGHMRSLANAVTAFVSRCPPAAGATGTTTDGGVRRAVVDLFDDMLACFDCLASGGGGSVGGGVPSRAGSPTQHSEEGESGGAGDVMSATSRLPPPPQSLLAPPMDTEDNAPAGGPSSVASNGDADVADLEYHGGGGEGGDGGGLVCSPEGNDSNCSSSLEPHEALSLQLIERMENLLSSFLPNERVDAHEFKASFNGLYDWWRRASAGGAIAIAGCDRRLAGRMSAIREQFECAQRHRADSSGVKRLCSEAETAWDLMEAAKLMLPIEERTASLMAAHTAPEWREATSGLVDSALATLYLYQTAQDASVLSMRLRADIQRLVARLTDCGPVPLLSLLRLRLMYLRARQFADLLRPHPQGCLILELMQTHRTLRRDEYSDVAGPLNLTVCVPLNDYHKFYQHVKDMRVLSFEARAPVTDKTSTLMMASCLKKIEKCCQCTIEFHPPTGAATTAAGGGGGGEATGAGAGTAGSDDAMTMGGGVGRRKPLLLVGGSRPSFGLVVRPDASHGRANAAMRMICDIVGPASIGDRVKYRGFHLAVSMPQNYRPLTVFAETSRPLT